MKTLIILLSVIPILLSGQTTYHSTKSDEQKVIYEESIVDRTVTIERTSIKITNWSYVGHTLQLAMVDIRMKPYGNSEYIAYECIGMNDVNYLVIPVEDTDMPHIAIIRREGYTSFHYLIHLDR